jgi:hypothetical protein
MPYAHATGETTLFIHKGIDVSPKFVQAQDLCTGDGKLNRRGHREIRVLDISCVNRNAIKYES